ncbi:hypothetical protein [Sphingomonas flavescens]|uniref:hypothetical protein n=1 Tax=Sphingomonas flavescens TaxID=3132797 RepID=UPI0028056FB2|nr:hypothetical protein [Sphingomonas limnosediminicola]
MDYKNENFEGVTVDLDGNSFKDCTFRDVTFKYAGGDLTMENCGMDRFRFQFDGALANGLFALYQLFGTEALIQIIRGFTDPADSQEDVVLAEKS